MKEDVDLRFLTLVMSTGGASKDRDIRLCLGPAGGFVCLFFSPDIFLDILTFSPDIFLATFMSLRFFKLVVSTSYHF